MKSLRVLTLAHPDLLPPESRDGFSEKEAYVWKTEYDVISTLRKSGHEVFAFGEQEDLASLVKTIEEYKPDIVFNLLEEFHSNTLFAQHVVSLMELMQIPYTGCNPRGVMLAKGKDLSKKLLKHHRIPVPNFEVFGIGQKVRKPRHLKYPVIVKSISEDASKGISQASVVESDERLAERVNFVHERIGTAAIAEQYIDGREIYVGMIGNGRKRVLPIWELEFSRQSSGWLIATEKVKHDPDYQEKRGVLQGPAENLDPNVSKRIRDLVRRISTILELDGYARIDFRLTADGIPYFIEANPNPEIASEDEFAQAALYDNIEYPDLLNKILELGLERAGVDLANA